MKSLKLKAFARTAKHMIMRELLSANALSINLDNQVILDNISLKIHEREVVTIIGPNGAGKSSLLRLLVGEFKADSGSIQKAHALKIGYVPQKLNLDGQIPLDVKRFLKLKPTIDVEATQNAIEKTKINPLMNTPLASLSGGEMRRVLLTYALAGTPEILILDEPTAGLDQAAMIDFYSFLEELRQSLGIAVLLVSHDLNIVMRSSDRVICLNKHICCQGSPIHVSNSPEYQALFGKDQTPIAIYKHHHTHAHDEMLGTNLIKEQ